LQSLDWIDVGDKVSVRAWNANRPAWARNLTGITPASLIAQPAFTRTSTAADNRISNSGNRELAWNVGKPILLALADLGWKVECLPGQFPIAKSPKGTFRCEDLYLLAKGEIESADWLKHCISLGIAEVDIGATLGSKLHRVPEESGTQHDEPAAVATGTNSAPATLSRTPTQGRFKGKPEQSMAIKVGILGAVLAVIVTLIIISTSEASRTAPYVQPIEQALSQFEEAWGSGPINGLRDSLSPANNNRLLSRLPRTLERRGWGDSRPRLRRGDMNGSGVIRTVIYHSSDGDFSFKWEYQRGKWVITTIRFP
jgi:hypothetical protein